MNPRSILVGRKLMQLTPSKLVMEFQPPLNKAHVDELVESIADSYQWHPVGVRKLPTGKYAVQFGRHRVAACAKLQIPVLALSLKAEDDAATVEKIVNEEERLFWRRPKPMVAEFAKRFAESLGQLSLKVKPGREGKKRSGTRAAAIEEVAKDLGVSAKTVRRKIAEAVEEDEEHVAPPVVGALEPAHQRARDALLKFADLGAQAKRLLSRAVSDADQVDALLALELRDVQRIAEAAIDAATRQVLRAPYKSCPLCRGKARCPKDQGCLGRGWLDEHGWKASDEGIRMGANVVALKGGR